MILVNLSMPPYKSQTCNLKTSKKWRSTVKETRSRYLFRRRTMGKKGINWTEIKSPDRMPLRVRNEGQLLYFSLFFYFVGVFKEKERVLEKQSGEKERLGEVRWASSCSRFSLQTTEPVFPVFELFFSFCQNTNGTFAPSPSLFANI